MTDPWMCDACTQETLPVEDMVSDHDTISYHSISPAQSPPRILKYKHRINPKGAWRDVEDALAIKTMSELQINRAPGRIDQLWDEISQVMHKNGYNRSAGAVKNQWNRRLRAMCGVDERAIKRPDLLRTGLLLPKGAKVTTSQRLTKPPKSTKRRKPTSTPTRKRNAKRDSRRWSTEMPIRERGSSDNGTGMQAFPSNDTVTGDQSGDEFGQEHDIGEECGEASEDLDYENDEESDDEEE